jgi:predicted RND superfamily exporter protein
VGSLTVGLGVTYAIHITHRYIEELDRQRDVDKALKKCLENTGLALFGAAATTVGGFLVLIWSTMPPMQQFGSISAMAIMFSMISSIFVLPSMLRIWARVREDRGTLYKDLPEEEPEEDIIRKEISESKPVAGKKKK